MASENGRDELAGYPVRREQWTVGGRAFTIVWPADMDALLDDPRTHRRFHENQYMPYWAQPWPSSAILAEQVLSEPPGGGRQAIELGCGVGLVSLAAAGAGWSVIASDYDADAVTFAVHNATANGLIVTGRILDFVYEPPDREYDLILAADLLYERRYAQPLARWIAAGLSPQGRALVGDPNRSAADEFTEVCAGLGLRISMAQVETRQGGAGLLIRGRLWTVTRG